MIEETPNQRGERILNKLKTDYPGKICYDIDGRNMHFVCEVEPVSEHSDYDKTVEVIILSRAHKYNNSAQTYRVISGSLNLHLGDDSLALDEGNQYEVSNGLPQWAESENECVVEVVSRPGRTKTDLILLS